MNPLCPRHLPLFFRVVLLPQSQVFAFMLFILHTHTHTSSWPFRDCHEPLQVATHSGWTPLMAAAYGGHLSTVVYLMVAIEPPPP